MAEDSEIQKSKLLPQHSCAASLSSGQGNERGITAEKSENCSHANASFTEVLHYGVPVLNLLALNHLKDFFLNTSAWAPTHSNYVK